MRRPICLLECCGGADVFEQDGEIGKRNGNVIKRLADATHQRVHTNGPLSYDIKAIKIESTFHKANTFAEKKITISSRSSVRSTTKNDPR